MNHESKVRSVASVIVTYNADPNTLQTLLDRLAPQVSRIFVVDNGSSNAQVINQTAELFNHVRVILCPTNLGLGHAHNLGIQGMPRRRNSHGAAPRPRQPAARQYGRKTRNCFRSN